MPEKSQLVNDLESIVGKGNVHHTKTALCHYEYDASLFRGCPKAVAFAQASEDVAKLVRYAYEHNIPYVARGSGTNLSGGTILEDGLTIEMRRMDKVLDINLENMTALVEPGIFNLSLQNILGKYGCYYAPDPASQKVATLGGNIGENSGGPKCLKYGVTSNHVLGLEVVLPNGEIVWMGGESADMPGPDLVGLYVGSEGTFGIVTKILVRIMKLPEDVITMLAIFDTIEEAGQTVSDIIAQGIIPVSLEIMDNLVIQAVEDSINAGFPRDAEAVLIIELDGITDGMEDQAKNIKDICHANNVVSFSRAKDAAARSNLWAGRKGAFGAVARLRPCYLCCDATVPRAQLPAALSAVKEVSQKYDLPIGNVFHAGDGNLHPLILFDDRDKDELSRVHHAGSEIMRRCAELGGTISGEHGIALEKKEDMKAIFNQDDLTFMEQFKKVIDPDNLCNPHKIFPETTT
jgi:glycolate oxidase subunit GlcD